MWCFRPPTQSRRSALLAQLGLAPGSFVLVVPGGGTGHPGAADAAARFYAAAGATASDGAPTAYVGPTPLAAGASGTASPTQLRAVPSLAQADLAELMRAARVIVANGGSTLLQAIACGAATIAVPIAGDQAERIRRAVEAGVCRRASLDAEAIARSTAALLADEPARAALAARAAALGLADGITVAVDALAQLEAHRAGADAMRVHA